MKNCLNCQKEYKPSDRRQKYCSCSCATTVNNRLYPRMTKKEHKCSCGADIVKKSGKKCRDCYNKGIMDRRGGISVEKAKTSRGPSIHAFTRGHAKSTMKFYGIPKICVVCSYDKYVEICHVRPISDFPGDTPLSIVNALNNLVHLCPNHHKEFDRNLIDETEKEIVIRGSEHLKSKQADNLIVAETERQPGSLAS